MKTRELTTEEYEIISSFITGLVAREYKNSRQSKTKVIEAIFCNFYFKELAYYIDIQFVKNNISCVNIDLKYRLLNDVIVRKIGVPSSDFSFDLNNQKQRVNAMNLSNGNIYVDTINEYYKSLAEEADRYGMGSYGNNVVFEPEIDFPKMQPTDVRIRKKSK